MKAFTASHATHFVHRWCARWGGRSVALMMVLAFAAAGIVERSADASTGQVPSYALKVAGGHFDHGSTWSIWLFGLRQAGSCWATGTVEEGLPSVNTICGSSVPPRAAQPASKGLFGSGRDRRSMLFFLTRRDVGGLNVRAVLNPGHRATWIHFKPRLLTGGQVARARLPHDFGGYAVKVFGGRLVCLQRISVLNWHDERLEISRNQACEER